MFSVIIAGAGTPAKFHDDKLVDHVTNLTSLRSNQIGITGIEIIALESSIMTFSSLDIDIFSIYHTKRKP